MIKTRIAPSPTGAPHIGTAYIALMNYMFAKQQGGEFILRIEDTDRARSTVQSEQAILEALRWLGLSWDAGPDVGGPHGPYRQSERLGIYQQHVQQLVDKGHAFHCFCKPERLDQLRSAQRAQGMKPRYDGHCLRLDGADVKARQAEGQASVVRMKIPSEGDCLVHDRLRDPVRFAWEEVDMQILQKSDGWPTYHLANVVDDYLMEITHVIRGEEWLPSLPKHQLLYAYFGWEIPEFIHLPLLRNLDRSKLSKRNNPTSILWYRQMGYWAPALLNFLGLHALSLQEGDNEVLTLDDLVKQARIEHIALGGPIFDTQKLDWLNGRWLRERLSDEEFCEGFSSWLRDRGVLDQALLLAKPRIEKFCDAGEWLLPMMQGGVLENAELLYSTGLSPEQVRLALSVATVSLSELVEFDKQTIQSCFKEISSTMGVKLGKLTQLFYVVFQGKSQGLPLFASMELLGADICQHRLRQACMLLGLSRAEQARWVKGE